MRSMDFAKLIFHFVSAFTISNVWTADKDDSVYCITQLVGLLYAEVLFGLGVYPGQVSPGYVSFCLSS